MLFRFISFIFCFFPVIASAFIELSANYSYQKQVFGTDEQNDSITKTYAGSIAWYFSSLTALELNYSVSQADTTSREVLDYEDWDISITEIFNKVTTDVYGIGIRQSFAPQTAFLRPLISIGYARQVEKSNQDVTFQDNLSAASTVISYPQARSDADSIFATFSLQFQVTRLISLKGSVNTIFPAFKFDQAKNNIKYLAGFSWAF